MDKKNLFTKELIAPCGMNCGLCVSFQFGKHDLNKLGYHRRYCPGCRPRGKNCLFMSKSCDLLKKGSVQFCFECPSFPCLRLQQLDKRYSTKYGMSMIENLRLINTKGIDRFLKEEEDKWKCPDCGEAVCCHTGFCLICKGENFSQKKIK